MAFGFLVDVPLLLAVFVVTAAFRKRIAAAMTAVKLPRLLLCLLIAVPFIIFEEDVNCMPAWCLKTIIPPTLPFLLVEILVLALLIRLSKTKRVVLPVFIYCVFGVAFEFTVGASNGQLAALGLPQTLFFYFWIGISYALVSLVPIAVLQHGNK